MRTLWLSILITLSASSHALTASGALNLYLENDAETMGGPGSDADYSNGVKVSYIYAQESVPRWSYLFRKAMDLMGHDPDQSTTNYGISLGHQIYTPENISDVNLIENDRPYAGWLYVGGSAGFTLGRSLHLVTLNVGMVGPSAHGKEVQTEVHHAMGIGKPKGWKHQLHDEPTLQMFYQHRFRAWTLKHKDITYLSAIPYWGASLGNVRIDLSAGALLLFGYGLGEAFGPARPSSSDVDTLVAPKNSGADKWSLYGFVGGKEAAIGRSLFLDGNNFQPSQHVDRIPFVFETEFGTGVQWSRVSAIWRYVHRGPEFKERPNSHSFASVNLMYQADF